MKPIPLSGAVLFGLAGACGTLVPLELTRAREAQQRVGEVAATSAVRPSLAAASEEPGSVEASRSAAGKLAGERAARTDSEQRSADAQQTLSRLGAVTREPRGVVITIAGRDLFAAGKATLLPDGRARLEQVAEAMLTTRERTAQVEGFSDSRGSPRRNLDLSRRRADAVRDFLVARGYEAGMIAARGFGEGRPVADNDSAEGRASNVRVEIVIEPYKTLSSN